MQIYFTMELAPPSQLPLEPVAEQCVPVQEMPTIEVNSCSSNSHASNMLDDERTIPFLRRLYEMLQENPSAMSFIPGTGPPLDKPCCSGGTCTCCQAPGRLRLGQIVVHDRKSVERDVIPRYFNHNSFASLRRQLNYFNFVRVGRGRQKGATYRNDGVVVLEDILKLKRRPNPDGAREESSENSSSQAAASGASFQVTSSSSQGVTQPGSPSMSSQSLPSPQDNQCCPQLLNAPVYTATRVVSQSDMSSTTPSSTIQEPDTPPPRILLKKRPYHGPFESEEGSKFAKSVHTVPFAVTSNDYLYSLAPPQHDAAVVYHAVPPVAPVSPCTKEDQTTAIQTHPVAFPGQLHHGYFYYSFPNGAPTQFVAAPTSVMTAAPVLPFPSAPAYTVSPLSQTMHQPQPILTYTVNEQSQAAGEAEANQSSVEVSQPVQEENDVLYETKDGFPLHKEDLLLCAALIHLGGPPMRQPIEHEVKIPTLHVSH